MPKSRILETNDYVFQFNESLNDDLKIYQSEVYSVSTEF